MTLKEKSAFTWLTGFIPDLPTPFDINGAIDLPAFGRLCRRQIEAGASALVVGESAGEFATLTGAEHERLVRTAVEIANGCVRVIAGAGSNSTQQAVELTQHAEKAGADAVLSVTPYYNKPMPRGIQAHFQTVAHSTNLPVILHDIPSRTVKNLSDDVLGALSQSSQFVGLRDGTGDAARVWRLRSALPESFRLLSGDDATALAYMACGGDGCISMLSNIAPRRCQELFRYCQAGDYAGARRLYGELLPLTSVLSGEIPAVKYALCLLGLCLPNVRLPMIELDESTKRNMTKLIGDISEVPLLAEVNGHQGKLSGIANGVTPVIHD